PEIGVVQDEPNGLAYIPDYRNWKAISSTERFDNGTMRIIFGNDIAVKAIQNNQTNPWPDGTSFAKTAWKQNVLPDGDITTGAFIQVEFMVKDAQKYAETKGWGWGRWKGNDLKPYGDNRNFDNECIKCHQPVKNRDYVFTPPLYLSPNIKNKK
ncbi:MAG: cytochrome P460 family protein, partial [Bacteroidota bacterium]